MLLLLLAWFSLDYGVLWWWMEGRGPGRKLLSSRLTLLRTAHNTYLVHLSLHIVQLLLLHTTTVHQDSVMYSHPRLLYIDHNCGRHEHTYPSSYHMVFLVSL